MAKKKRIKRFVLEYRSDGTRETVIWGPENLVDEMLLVDDINMDTIRPGIVVHKREQGSFYRDYHEAIRDMEKNIWIYVTFQKYLSFYYIPLSKGENPVVRENDAPLEFLEIMKEQHNVVYNFIADKVEYYIQNEKELPISVFSDFFYNDNVTDIFFDKKYGSISYHGKETLKDIAGQMARANYDRVANKHTLERTVERLEQEAKMLVSAIKELAEDLEEFKEENDEHKE